MCCNSVSCTLVGLVFGIVFKTFNKNFPKFNFYIEISRCAVTEL